MEKSARWPAIASTIMLWTSSVVVALGIGIAGLTKFLQPNRWEPLFTGWGYPAWFSLVVGIVEVCGAIALLVPAIAFYAATLLAVVMAGALVTLLRHPQGPLGWGRTPSVYIILLIIIAVWRSRQRRSASRADRNSAKLV
jgi:putative oxidoreductase